MRHPHRKTRIRIEAVTVNKTPKLPGCQPDPLLHHPFHHIDATCAPGARADLESNAVLQNVEYVAVGSSDEEPAYAPGLC